jgi:folate-binding protein YgfZ
VTKGVGEKVLSMTPLHLHEFHKQLGAEFARLNEAEVCGHYGNPATEHRALWESVGLVDLSFRTRLCLAGADRQKFLHGQVTNDVNRLRPGQGCYAALITAKGKMQSDLNIYLLENEILLDFEPGLAATVAQRLERYVISDDVQIVDVGPYYGLLSVQGPTAAAVVGALDPTLPVPDSPMASVKRDVAELGEIYLINHPRLATAGFDLFVPVGSLGVAAERVRALALAKGGCLCGWQAFDLTRIEAGVPRFGVDMDETNLAPETGIEERAISYTKGCYIGQEVIARIRTYGQVTKHLRGLVIFGETAGLPQKGAKLFQAEKEVGYITSAVYSPKAGANIALGYVRREAQTSGTALVVQSGTHQYSATVVDLPFRLAPISSNTSESLPRLP